MKIILVADTLLTGGAEWFLLRQYRYLKEKGHSVYLFVTRPDHMDNRVLQKFPDTQIHSPSLLLIRLAAFTDRFFQKLFQKPFLLDFLNCMELKSLIKKIRPDVIQSHLFQSDYKVFLANRKIREHHVITIHGDYIEHIKKKENPFLGRMKKVLLAADKIVIISEEQKLVLGGFLPSITDKLKKIYNGYPLEKIPPKPSHEGFYFGMIARAIPEKGWEEAILAFLKLNHPEYRLLLYGEGNYLQYLKQKYTNEKIIFRGFTNEPLTAILEMDAGLFPSYYPSESLPTSITEYLLLQKPIITTRVGECAEMIRHGEEYAGIVLDLKNGRPDIDELSEAMQRMATDKLFNQQCSLVANEAKKKFGMENCMNQYLEVYQKNN